MTSVADLTGRRLASVLAREQVDGRLPSVVAGVVRDGALVWSGARGSRTGGPAASADVQYRIGSLTKTLVAVLVMQLRDEGLIDLGDRLDAHLPGVAYGDRTIRALLSHSSGMHSEPAGSWWERSPGRSFEELAAGLDEEGAPFAPGATFHYTNVAFGLLGEVVARLRGGGWWEQADKRILTPLGMSRTTYLPQPPAATGYSVHHFANTLTEEPAQDAGAMAPAGQVWSTLSDLATYADFLVGGRDGVLSRSTLDEMATPQSASLVGASSGGYGLGLRLMYTGSRTLVGHTGSMPGFLAGMFVDRDRGTAAVALANATSGMRCEGLPADLLETLEELEPTLVPEWVPTTSVPAVVADVLGVWHWGNTAFGFSWDGREVVVKALGTGAVSYRFAPVPDAADAVAGPDEGHGAGHDAGPVGGLVGTAGYHHGERLHVVRNPDGTVNHLRCATFVYTRVPYDPEAPIPGGHPA